MVIASQKKKTGSASERVHLRFCIIMIYRIEPAESEKIWTIVSDKSNIGTVERLSTGYLVTLIDPPKKIKRFRIIDALKEALGDNADIEMPE
jgi:hypothetical protein